MKAGATTEFRVLGPVQAVSEGRLLPLGGPKQRALLAELLLHRGAVLPRDHLVDALWDEPPSSARSSLQVYVHGLRRVLGNDRIETHGDGYRVRVEPSELDLSRFERLVGKAEHALAEERVADAADDLDAALALWAGPPLADVADQPAARVATQRLEELRLRAVELRNDARLELGGHDALLPELEQLIGEEPYRERLREQQILALYRAGRQKEALEAYRSARRVLVDELGVEPGPALQELERAILRQDAGLEVAARGATCAAAAAAGSGDLARRAAPRDRRDRGAAPTGRRAAAHPDRARRNREDAPRPRGRSGARARAARRGRLRRPFGGRRAGARLPDDRPGARAVRVERRPRRGGARAPPRPLRAPRARQPRAAAQCDAAGERAARRRASRPRAGDEPRAVATLRRARVPGAAAPCPCRGRPVRRGCGERRRAPVRGAGASRRPELRAHGRECLERRVDVPEARRPTARDRARGGARQGAAARLARAAARPGARAARRRGARPAAPPADAARDARLELRAPPGGRAGAPGSARGLRGRLDARGRGGGARRDDDVGARVARRQQPRPPRRHARGAALRPARDDPRVRARAAAGGRRGGRVPPAACSPLRRGRRTGLGGDSRGRRR